MKIITSLAIVVLMVVNEGNPVYGLLLGALLLMVWGGF